MILNCKQRSILFCIISFSWVWLSFLVRDENFINHLTEPSSHALRMTGTDGVAVVGGGTSTPFTSVKDHAQFLNSQTVMNAAVLHKSV